MTGQPPGGDPSMQGVETSYCRSPAGLSPTSAAQRTVHEPDRAAAPQPKGAARLGQVPPQCACQTTAARMGRSSSSFTGPVLIVWAREEKLMPPEHAERLAKHFETAELTWVDDNRTLIPIDQPEILAVHLEDFLARTTVG